MDDTHALQINHVKGLIESALADLQITEPADEYDAQGWAFVCFKLAEVRDLLSEAAVKAGEHSEAAIPFNRNTAQEISNALAFLALLGNPNVEADQHPEAQFN
jgi:hypothetical protein